MKKQITSQLYLKKRSFEFYEDRYKGGYMNNWSIEKKKKIIEIIQELKLPDKGDALDFGCGNGVLTDVLRHALPSWRIYGMDISKTAVCNAKKRYPNCIFFEPNDSKYTQMRFDLVFTNHVFEHVFNIKEVFNQMESYLKSVSSMIHFLPCGNKGSFEYEVCLLRKDGINANIGNRFFFEDEGHVRRLTSNEFIKLCITKGFVLKKEFYSNHYYGAIDWITATGIKFVKMFSDSSMAIDNAAKKKLKKIRRRLIAIALVRTLPRIYISKIKKEHKKPKHYMFLILGFPFYVITMLPNQYYKKKSRDEWRLQKFKHNGSEMCLFFMRE